MATRDRVIKQNGKRTQSRLARSGTQSKLKKHSKPVNGSKAEKIIQLSCKLEEINKRILSASELLKRQLNPTIRHQVRLALEYYDNEKSMLLQESQVTYDEVLGVMRSLKNKDNYSLRGCKVEENRLAGIRLVEASIHPGNYNWSTYTKAYREMGIGSNDSASAVIEKLCILAHEYIEATPGLVECPRCGSRNTSYQEYSIIVDSECLACGDCMHLWRLPDPLLFTQTMDAS